MRLSSGLLMGGASSAFGQFTQFTRFTNTSTSAFETSTSSTELQTFSVPPTASIETTATGVETTASSSASVFAPIVLSLKGAILGPGASFYPPPDDDTILMSPVATDSTLKRRAVPAPVVVPSLNLLNFASTSFRQQFSAAIASQVGVTSQRLAVTNITCAPEACGQRSKRADSSPCAFQIIANGEVVQITPIPENFSGSLEISSNPFILKPSNEYKFQQACGDVIVPVIIAGVTLKDAQGATPTPIPTPSIGVSTGSETGSSTETSGAGFTTNSEGQTISPTETATKTNSQGFTTNSNGETIFPTGTDIATNSEGATTNSDGETVFPTETVTGVHTNSEGATTNSEGETVFPTGTSTGTISASSTSVVGFPGDVGGFSLFGCAGSTSGFPTYTLAESSSLMDLDVCAGLCEGHAYFGVHDTAYQCDIECPGDKTQFCGGEVENKLRARQAISRNILLTLYAKAEAAISATESVTRTVTNQETIVTTFTTFASGESIATEVVTATLVCVDGKCHSSSSNNVAVYIFIEVNGSDCDGQWVYISEPCSGGQQYIPHSCSDGECAGIKVYKPQPCPDWYNYKSYYTPSDCSTPAQGKISYQPWEKSWATPDNCNDQVPICNTLECPSQQGIVRPHHGISWNSTIRHGGSGGVYNSIPDGGSSGGSSSGSQGDTEGSGSSGSEDSPPSTVPVISGAIKQVSCVLSLLVGLLALL
ncbi:hypothetical protein FNYG_05732 [Fusarium nygamai]|uniref:WSC domain-containing protein n=1 Tax=Gibberella nygamai TaxID=42673 RepID=A0A2K0WF65_GIBNY|nr:hypothetical protein FNYG_05732 [Fusarium nygamai]